MMMNMMKMKMNKKGTAKKDPKGMKIYLPL